MQYLWRGVSFFTYLLDGFSLLETQSKSVESGCVRAGDGGSFTGLRALLTQSKKRTNASTQESAANHLPDSGRPVSLLPRT